MSLLAQPNGVTDGTQKLRNVTTAVRSEVILWDAGRSGLLASWQSFRRDGTSPPAAARLRRALGARRLRRVCECVCV